MKHFVFAQPALSRFASDVVFASVDTDRDGNAAFVDKYAVDVWPTLFVLEPEKGEVLGYWPGSASLAEVEKLLEGSLALVAEHGSAGNVPPDSAQGLLLRAKQAQARQRYADAAQAYEKAVKAAPRSWPRRSEALLGWIGSLHHAGRAGPCVNVGKAHATEVVGAALPADFCSIWLSCSKGLASAQARNVVRRSVAKRLEQIVASPPAAASVDDVADAWEILADARLDLGDKAGARAAHEKRLSLLEQAAASAPTPAAASTYDYGRAVSYVALGQADKAVKMLEEREREVPDSYEPPARLASVLAGLKRWPDALAAVDRALQHAYGPRKLSYLELKERIQVALGDRAGVIKTLEQQLTGWQEQARRLKTTPKELADVKRRLQKAKAANPSSRP
jgi:tetratricopeptide (TPR) repeat protein